MGQIFPKKSEDLYDSPAFSLEKEISRDLFCIKAPFPFEGKYPAEFIFSLYSNDKNLYIFLYKGKNSWNYNIRENGVTMGVYSSPEEDLEFKGKELDEMIFTKVLSFFQNADFDRAYLGPTLRAFELFFFFIKWNFEGENKEEKIKEYLRVKQIFLEKSFELVKANF